MLNTPRVDRYLASINAEDRPLTVEEAAEFERLFQLDSLDSYADTPTTEIGDER